MKLENLVEYWVYLLIYIILATIFWKNKNILYEFSKNWFIYEPLKLLISISFIAILLICLLYLLIIIGKTIFPIDINENFKKCGIKNKLNEPPLPVGKYRLPTNIEISIIEIFNNGLTTDFFKDNIEKLERIFKVKIIEIEYCKNIDYTRLFTLPFNKTLPSYLPWSDDYLNKNDFILSLGKSLLKNIELNLNTIPHVLIGASSGSGKTELLKLTIMQCLKKDCKIFIADFKGGIDFSDVWEKKCSLITNENDLLDILTKLVNELEERKVLFKKENVSNYKKYNELGHNLERVIFACDEIAEVLDKTGVSKEQKELIQQIENKLATLSRQSRAFGIHLIIATQRPDATILNGQIKNNINYRVCGRADDVLSNIVLDNTSASQEIPSDSKGMFINHNGEVFQAYIFEDEHLL